MKKRGDFLRREFMEIQDNVPRCGLLVSFSPDPKMWLEWVLPHNNEACDNP